MRYRAFCVVGGRLWRGPGRFGDDRACLLACLVTPAAVRVHQPREQRSVGTIINFRRLAFIVVYDDP